MSPSKYSPCELMHFCIRSCHPRKHLANSSSWRLFSSLVTALLISPENEKLVPFITLFSLGKSQKSQVSRSGEYRLLEQICDKVYQHYVTKKPEMNEPKDLTQYYCNTIAVRCYFVPCTIGLTRGIEPKAWSIQSGFFFVTPRKMDVNSVKFSKL